MRLIEVEKVANLDKDTFKEQYLDPQLPVVSLISLVIGPPYTHGPLNIKIQIRYTLGSNLSNTIISLNKGHLSPIKTMPFKDYLDMIQAQNLVSYDFSFSQPI
ncbi:MAG: hypothetical protein IPM04_11670 [Saprospiraceae bacterium]|nr:hypothetical protein [Candidatus Brachybacter algidus]MBK8748491.1 hypothetical protein [Candidatus Brachybacter algidus]